MHSDETKSQAKTGSASYFSNNSSDKNPTKASIQPSRIGITPPEIDTSHLEKSQFTKRVAEPSQIVNIQNFNINIHKCSATQRGGTSIMNARNSSQPHSQDVTNPGG